MANVERHSIESYVFKRERLHSHSNELGCSIFYLLFCPMINTYQILVQIQSIAIANVYTVGIFSVSLIDERHIAEL